MRVLTIVLALAAAPAAARDNFETREGCLERLETELVIANRAPGAAERKSDLLATQVPFETETVQRLTEAYHASARAAAAIRDLTMLLCSEYPD